MRKFVFSFMVLAVLALPPAAAFAQKAVSEDGAAELRRVVDETIKFERDVATQSGAGLKLGDPQVSIKGSYYEVRLPDVAYHYPDIGTIDIGTVVLNVTHGHNVDEYLASMALQPTLHFNAADGDKLSLQIGKQKFAMAWQATLQYPTRIDADYGDLKITTAKDKDFEATVANLRVIVNMQSNGDGTWSGPIETEIRDARINIGKTDFAGGGKVALARFYNKTEYDSLDLPMILQSRKNMQALVKSADGQAVEDVEKVLEVMIDGGNTVFAGAKAEVMMENLSINVAPLPAPEGQTPEEPRALRLAELSSLVEIKGLKTEKGSLAAQVALKDFSGSNLVAPESAGYLPQNASIELYMDDMPMASLYKTFAGLLVQGARAARMAEDAEQRGQPSNLKRHHESQVMAAAMVLPQMLAGAGSTVSIRNTFMRSADLSTNLFGSFKATPGAAKVAVGEMTLTIQGLDELLKKLEGGNTRQSRRALQGLSFLQVLGQQDTEGGKPVRRYVFAVTADGSMTLNGSEVGGLMGGMPQ
ncbi:MAG: hypothetical protein Q8K65_04825 [Alphaproteobacteria bacterium]|nr:hypothetical protein [Alphaproteobacteria bacterium]